jgi:nucleoid DNA-binding protein
MATNLRMKEKPGKMIEAPEIAERIYNLNILNKIESKRFCKIFLEAMNAIMLEKEDIAMEGFGILYTEQTKSREWYDIAKKKLRLLEPAIKYRFKPSISLKRLTTKHRGYVEIPPLVKTFDDKEK